ncbi:helix-turn-helix domain-containing protein [Streptomyces stelliscabiei]|uniref:helix-turn-helix domain-containing protein n=1 Tax=Streptomyces stelliscabiei TaxID=146820 RepID=UPI0029B60EEA|nr:helix-turn-helix transcriptional regulator [Streptomyces stelliscabiei]MDX2550108.1 helix-turn-helix transcriptional regulator [Streptomyces stelliscabiei]
MTEPRRDAVSLIVANNITAARRRNGWRLADVSDRTEQAGKRVGVSTLSRIENGRDGHRTVVISVDDLVALAAAFETSPEDLLTEQTPNCSACLDAPPPGFTCNACRSTAG